MAGGGLEAGESVVQAAVRELREETGLELPPALLTREVWRRRHDFTWAGRAYRYLEHYLMARLPGPVQVSPFPGDPGEAKHLVAMRWVSCAELQTWPDLVA